LLANDHLRRDLNRNLKVIRVRHSNHGDQSESEMHSYFSYNLRLTKQSISYCKNHINLPS